MSLSPDPGGAQLPPAARSLEGFRLPARGVQWGLAATLVLAAAGAWLLVIVMWLFAVGKATWWEGEDFGIAFSGYGFFALPFASAATAAAWAAFPRARKKDDIADRGPLAGSAYRMARILVGLALCGPLAVVWRLASDVHADPKLLSAGMTLAEFDARVSALYPFAILFAAFGVYLAGVRRPSAQIAMRLWGLGLIAVYAWLVFRSGSPDTSGLALVLLAYWTLMALVVIALSIWPRRRPRMAGSSDAVESPAMSPVLRWPLILPAAGGAYVLVTFLLYVPYCILFMLFGGWAEVLGDGPGFAAAAFGGVLTAPARGRKVAGAALLVLAVLVRAARAVAYTHGVHFVGVTPAQHVVSGLAALLGAVAGFWLALHVTETS